LAIAFGSVSSTSINPGTSVTPSDPSDGASGDVYIGFWLGESAITNLARPSGWTLIVDGTTGVNMDYDVSYVVRGGSAPNLTWSWTSSSYAEVYVLRFTGVDTANPIDAQAASVFVDNTAVQGNTRAASDIDPPAMTTNTANTMAIALAAHWSGFTGAWTPPTNYDLRGTSHFMGMIATRSLAAAGSEDPDEFFTNNTFSDDAFAFTFALREAVSRRWLLTRTA
jgi:hypothetical protein